MHLLVWQKAQQMVPSLRGCLLVMAKTPERCDPCACASCLVTIASRFWIAWHQPTRRLLCR